MGYPEFRRCPSPEAWMNGPILCLRPSHSSDFPTPSLSLCSSFTHSLLLFETFTFSLSANPHIVSFLTTLSSLLPIKAVHSLCLPEFFSFSLASNIILYFLLNISSELFFFCLFYYHGPSVNSMRCPSRLFPL